MKKAKKMLALVTVLSLAFGSATLVFAETEKKDDATVVYDGRFKRKDVKETEAPAEETREAEQKVSEYADLAYKSKYMYNSRNEDVGTYPVITDVPALSDRIAMDLLKIIQGESLAENYKDYPAVEGQESIVQFNQEHDFNVGFEAPVEYDRYTRIPVEIKYYSSSGKLEPQLIVLEYYVDKDTMTEIDKATFDAALEAMEEAETEAEVEVDNKDELIIVPLRVIAEKIGFKIGWDAETEGVVLTKGDVKVEFQTDVNKFIVNDKEEVELEVAPTNIDGIMHVPSTLFSEILGYNLTINADGNFVLVEKEVEDAEEVIVVVAKKVEEAEVVEEA